MIAVISVLVALPLAFPLFCLVELPVLECGRSSSRFLRSLAGVPTVVYGYFALLTVTPFLQTFLPNLQGFNALSAGLVLGVMITPLVASLSEAAPLLSSAQSRKTVLRAGRNQKRNGGFSFCQQRSQESFRL